MQHPIYSVPYILTPRGATTPLNLPQPPLLHPPQLPKFHPLPTYLPLLPIPNHHIHPLLRFPLLLPLLLHRQQPGSIIPLPLRLDRRFRPCFLGAAARGAGPVEVSRRVGHLSARAAAGGGVAGDLEVALRAKALGAEVRGCVAHCCWV